MRSRGVNSYRHSRLLLEPRLTLDCRVDRQDQGDRFKTVKRRLEVQSTFTRSLADNTDRQISKDFRWARCGTPFRMSPRTFKAVVLLLLVSILPMSSQSLFHLCITPAIDHYILVFYATIDEQPQNVFPFNSVVGDDFEVSFVCTL